ncbi:amino acid adenylation domain-containing protein [Peterkaempfera sp. SMS 1(5)a]|uniref:non-ribosomal peptide synthetase n=1 Tax=Peterkaempfera podocarpi TaxID=3232308 RepID=UPI003670B37F
MLRLSDTERVLLLTMHHIAVDGWSVRVLLGELARGYELLRAGRPDDQEHPEFQYADYSEWQDEWLAGPAAERQEEYWRGQLAGELPVVEHPATRRRVPTTGSRPSAVHHFSLPADSVRGLATLCARSNTTLFTGLLGAFDVLLSRYTGLDDIVVGVPMANRHHEEFENTVGLFVNTTVVRADLSGEPTFAELLTSLSDTMLDAQENQDLPFERLVELTGAPQDLVTSPLFQVMFTLHQGRDQAFDLPGLHVAELTPEVDTAKFDLLLDAVQTAEGVECSIEYRSDALSAETVSLFAQHYSRLVDAVVSAPDVPVGGLRVLTDAEYERWVPEPVAPAGTSDRCHELFAEWARRTPQAPAVTFRGEHIGYAELDRRANRLAHLLRSLGVGPGIMVGLGMDRSPDLLVGILGILKAGGCYVPLDPAYPAERLQYMAEDSGIGIMVANGAAVAERASFTGRIVDLSRDEEELASWPDSPPEPCGSPDDLAYVIYTSGSTGRPKGVLVPHRAITRLFTATRPWFGFGQDDVWTLFHSYAFDFSVWEIWGALAHGGRLVVVDYETSRTPAAFHQLVREQHVTVLNQTPSAFTQFSRADAESGTSPADLALRYVIFGGEALELSGLRDWFTAHGDAKPQLVNMYGITETTVHVTYRPITVQDLDAERGSVIGTAIPDLRLYVLDRHLQPVPTGATGELHVGGAGLAEGYLNRPELTADRFIRNPFAPHLEDRLYRTGDLVAVLSDGELEYRGRIDNQVKLRGFRIELGEIEAALLGHQSVAAAVVLLRQDAQAHPYLAAYVVRAAAGGDGHPLDEVLRAHVAARLPDYMVPAVFSELSAFPLTTNGKIDKVALPDPRGQAATADRSRTAPRTDIERTLAQIWSRALEQPQVGIDDTYLSLGGDSIRSIRVLAEAREAGLDFSLGDLLTRQTIRRIAEVTTSSQPESPRATREPFDLVGEPDRARLPEDLEDAYPMTELQLGMVFHSDLSPTGHSQYHDFWTYRLRVPYSSAAWQSAVAQVFERHEILRTSFSVEGFSEPMQLVHRHVELPLTVEDLRHLSAAEHEEAVATRTVLEQSTPFDWSRAPFARFHLQRLTDNTVQLYMVWHHAILDGWSERSLFVELLQRYGRALREPDAPRDDRLAYRFRDFVELERAAVKDPQAAHYWADSLDGYSFAPFVRAPAKAAGTHLPTMGFSLEPLPQPLNQALRRLSEKLGEPVRTLLLAAHLRVMGAVAGTSDVVTGAVFNGRGEARDADKCLGLFLNTLPLRMRMDGSSWAELIRRTARLDADIQQHRRFPMAQIRRQVGRPVLFDTYFNYTHFHVEQSLAEYPEIEVLDATGSGDNNFTFGAAFSMNSATGELALGMRYDAALISEGQLSALRSRYELALAQMADAPHSSYGSTNLLSAAERGDVEAWSGSEPLPEAPAATLAGLLALAAREHRDATAVVFGDERVSYGRLDALTTRLARTLRDAGVTPDRRVAICLDDSVDLIAAILAVLKAGGAYVPLDPAQPTARLQSLLADSGALLLTDAQHSIRLAGFPGERVRVDELLGEPDSADDQAPLPEVSGSEHLAYVIYTSGSTGTPKGVAVAHREIVGYLSGIRERLGLRPSAVYGLSQSLAFDFSMTMLYLSLTTGGTLHLLPRHLTGDELATAVEESGFDYLKMTPSHLSALGAAQDVERLLPRRALLLGGEGSAAEWSAQLAARRVCEVFNHYGPTEATVGMTVHQVTADGIDGATPIGRPLPGARAYVLDDHLQPVPPGTVGELYLGGARLARGYLDRAALTAERFVADPFGPPGARMYRSGDLARWLPGGILEFLGRRDHQIKIRGHRLELGEVEAALRELPGIAQAVAVPHPADAPRQLIAYLEALPGARPMASGELRRQLQALLPEHMVPSRFLTLDRLPLQSHGKIDRKALPDPDSVDAGPAQVREEPATELERVVAQAWHELLGGARPGVTDDFFELGGDSLLATRLVGRLRRELPQAAAPVRVRDLFTHRTVRALASLLAQSGATDGPGGTTGVSGGERQQGLLPSVRQQGLWFLNQQHPSSTYNVPTAVWLDGALDLAALRLALSDLVARHETLRSVFEAAQGELRLRLLDPAGIDLPLVPVTESEVPETLARLGDVPFDLSVEVPFRAHLLRVGPERHLLLLVIHHVATDGASRAALYRDLAAAYTARASGRAPAFAPLPVRYTDYAARQREFLGDPAAPGSEAARQLSFWKQALAGLAEETVLPADHPRPAAPSHRGTSHQVVCPAEVHARLVELARETGTTLFMVVQAATAAVLNRLGAGHDLAIGVPVDGRADEALDDLVGFFVNTVVLRTRTDGARSFRELLLRVRETDTAAWAHQDVPFDWVVEALNPERAAARNPLFQVLMTVQDEADDALELPGLTTRTERVDTGIAKFDLSFGFTRRRDPAGAPDELLVAVGGSVDLYDARTVRAVAERTALLLAAVAQDPDVPLTQIELLDDREREQLSAQWSGQAAGRPPATPVELFTAQAVRRPEAVALVSGGERVGYGTLDAMADRFAQVLAEHGTRQGSAVAVALGRSVELAVAMLAVLKCGALCVPVDPGSPAEEIAALLALTGPCPVVVDPATADSLPAGLDLPRIVLDRSALTVGKPAGAAPGAQPADPAYLVRTPGSATPGSATPPTGVALTHGGLAAAVQATAERFGFGDDDVWVWSHSPASALALWELWGCLAHGGTLVVAPTTSTAQELLQLLERERVTVLARTASAFRALVRQDAVLAPDLALRTVVVADEPVAVGPVADGPVPDWYARHPRHGVRLERMYGVMDLGLPVAYAPLDGGAPVEPAGLRALVLDGALRPLPVGAVGELYVAGPQAADGRAQLPGTTTAHAVDCPVEPGLRMLRTGYLARRSEDGRLEYAGRSDERVRSRGSWVDLGAVRAELAGRPEVAEAAVALGDGPDGSRVVACVVPADTTVTARELEAQLRDRLADPSVPAIVLLPELPRTTDGWLDRQALAAATPGPDAAPGTTGTALDDELCTLMAEILNVPAVGPQDNFFALGGQSLLAVRFLGRVKEVLNLGRTRLTIRDLYRSPTVAQLAQHLRTQVRSNPMVPVLTMREGNGEPLFCLPAVSGLTWAFSGILPHIGESRPIIGLQSEQLLNPTAGPADFEQLVTAHVARIREAHPDGPFHLMGWSFGGVLAHAVAARLESLGERVGTLALLDARPPAGRRRPADRRWALALLLGRTADGLPEPATDEELIELLRANEPVLGMLEAEQVAAVVATTMANRTAFLSHEVREVFTGDVVFFNATRTSPLPGTKAWAPFVRGEIHEYDIDCGHVEMTRRQPLEAIGRLLDAHLGPSAH